MSLLNHHLSWEEGPPSQAAKLMRTWGNQDWRTALSRWSKHLCDAILHPDDERAARVENAIRVAMKERHWGAMLELFPHSTGEQTGTAAYALLTGVPDMTWSALVALRPPHVTPLSLARSVMFIAAGLLDEVTLRSMLQQGAQLTDRDATGRTVVGYAADHLSGLTIAGTATDHALRAQALIEACWSTQPKPRWFCKDVRRVVIMGDTSWALRTLGDRPDPAWLEDALNQAIVFHRAPLIKTWLPHLIEVAQCQRDPPSPARSWVDVMENVLVQAVDHHVEGDLFREMTRQLHPWCGRDTIEKAFLAATMYPDCDLMDTLWPHVRPRKVVASVLNAKVVNLEVLDWILARVDSSLRDEHLPRYQPDELPLAFSRQQADHRERNARMHVPRTGPRRSRS